MRLVLVRKVGKRVLLELGAQALLGSHRIVVHGDELRDAREVGIVGKRIAGLVSPAARDLGAERQCSGGRARSEKRRAVTALDPAEEEAPVHGLRRPPTRRRSRAVRVPTYFVFFFNETAPSAIYTLSLHDALPV